MYEKPNFTQTPNLFFDEHLKAISKMSELKVTLVILRHTFGFHEKNVKLTVPELIGHTGLSRPSVIEGIGLAVERGTVKRRKEGRTFVYEPMIATVKNLNSSSDGTVKIFEQKVNCSGEEALVSLNKEINTGKSYKPPKKTSEPKTPYPPDNFEITKHMRDHLAERFITFPDEELEALTDSWRLSRNGRSKGARNLWEWQNDWLMYVRTTWERRSKNGNGHKREENGSGGYHSPLVAPEKPVDYFEKINAQYQTK